MNTQNVAYILGQSDIYELPRYYTAAVDCCVTRGFVVLTRSGSSWYVCGHNGFLRIQLGTLQSRTRYITTSMFFFGGIPWRLPWDPRGSRGCIMGCHGIPTAASHRTPRAFPWDPVAPRGIPRGPAGCQMISRVFPPGIPRVPVSCRGFSRVFAGSHLRPCGLPCDPASFLCYSTGIKATPSLSRFIVPATCRDSPTTSHATADDFPRDPVSLALFVPASFRQLLCTRFHKLALFPRPTLNPNPIAPTPRDPVWTYIP